MGLQRMRPSGCLLCLNRPRVVGRDLGGGLAVKHLPDLQHGVLLALGWLELRGTDRRLDFGVRKFDVATGENWSVYFRVVNTRAHKASSYYIVDLSARSPLIIMADSLDVGSGVRRREVWDETIQAHDHVTEQVLAKLLERAAAEAGQP